MADACGTSDENSNVSKFPAKISKEHVKDSPKKKSDLKSINNPLTEDTKASEVINNNVFMEQSTSENVPQFIVKDERDELHKLYFEGLNLTQKFKNALNTHRTRTFFKPDANFLRGMQSTIAQIETAVSKMGLLFKPQLNASDIEKNVISYSAITPPMSECGADAHHNESNNISGLMPLPADLDFTSSSRARKCLQRVHTDSFSGVSKSNDGCDSKKRGRKRKAEQISPTNCTMGITPISVKRPRRSLLSDFLTKKPTDEEKEDKAKVDDDKGSNSDDDKADGVFEVESIQAYDKVKGSYLYHVRWRGYGPDEDTWEPLKNLTGCEQILLKFLRIRLAERSKVTTYEELKRLPLPCDEGIKPLLRAAFFARMPPPTQNEVDEAVPFVISDRIKIKTIAELEEDVDRLVAIKDWLGERYQKLFAEFKFQLILIECKQQRERQKAELRRWEREMSLICSDPAPLSVINDVDLSLPPKDFVYVNDYVSGPGITIPQDPVVGCDCVDCVSCQNGCCPKQMNSFFAYNKYGRLKVSLGTAVYECNKLCRCFKSGSCGNRIVQKGRNVQLTIFRTDNDRGWGVKAGELIKAGTFVTEYVGEVISSEEAERRGQIYDAKGCTYLFDLDYNKGDLNPYTVDAAKFGNVSHFINHSCDPNLVVFNVWINCLDPDLPKLALFATRDIKKGEEVTFDYNSSSVRPQSGVVPVQDEFDKNSSDLGLSSPIHTSSQDSACGELLRKTPRRGLSNGKTKCHCGAANCRKYFF